MRKFYFRGVRRKAKKMESKALVRLTFRLEENHLKELEDYASKNGMTNSFLVRHLVIRFLDTQRRPVPSLPVGGIE